MYVSADLRSAPFTLALEEPDDFRMLKVVASATRADEAKLVEALTPIGALDEDGNALLVVEALKQMHSAEAQDHAWAEAFDGMVEYARARGWVSTDGRSLQAHCEWLLGA
jgi:hypothetical protein